jgi:hypothetical protein
VAWTNEELKAATDGWDKRVNAARPLEPGIAGRPERRAGMQLALDVAALRKMLETVGGYLMTAKLRNQPEWMEYIPTIISEADELLARTSK